MRKLALKLLGMAGVALFYYAVGRVAKAIDDAADRAAAEKE